MSLATEETKTVWLSLDGTDWETKKEAERDTMETYFMDSSTAPNPLSHFLDILVARPEAKDWLLQQLGEQPRQEILSSSQLSNLLNIALRRAGDTLSQNRPFDVAKELHGLLYRKVNIEGRAQETAQPQQEVYDTEAKAALFNSIEGSCKSDAVANLIFKNLTHRGYKLVKA